MQTADSHLAQLTPLAAELRRRLMAWYRRRARDLPWRRTRDPYAIWVSEIMLQQTQVATVAGYFPRFLERFPTIAALAAASEQQVLREWEGLGYYRRARQMHRAAQEIVADHQGRFPSDPEAARALPGIGRYTCGAILSIAFDARQPIVEANTERLLCRLLGYRGDPRQAPGQRVLWQAAEALLPRRGAGQFNQALMELGSLICTPRSPRCGECPLVDICRARKEGLTETIPPPARRPEPLDVHEAAVAIWRRGRVLLVEQSAAGRWQGLWDFPRFRLPGELRGARNTRSAIARMVRDATNLDVRLRGQASTIRHGVTRYRITLACFEADHVAGRLRRTAAGGTRWLPPAEMEELPLHVTARQFARQLARQAAR